MCLYQNLIFSKEKGGCDIIEISMTIPSIHSDPTFSMHVYIRVVVQDGR